MKPDFEKMATGMISAANPQLRVTVAAAISAAYAAGLERAAEIALESNMVVGSVRLGVGIAHKIRAEKGSDHG